MESIKSLIVAGIIILVIIAGGVFFYSRGDASKTTKTQSGSNPGVSNTQAATTGRQELIFTGQQDISVNKSGFSPAIARIKVGTRVKWTNTSGGTASIDSDHSSYPAMNFGKFSNGSSFELVFDTPGTYKYVNDTNLTIGTIIVQ